MRILRSVALVVNWAVAILAGGFALGWPMWGFITGDRVTMLSDRALAVIMVSGLIVIALNIMLLWRFLGRAFGGNYLRLEGAGGRINVSIKALENEFERSLGEIPEVTRARVRVFAPTRKGKPVVIRAHVNLRGSVVYHSISRAIIGVLESRFSETVSESTPVECHVFWEKIRQEHGPSPDEQATGETLRPQFPVGEQPEA